MISVIAKAKVAKVASIKMSALTTELKNRALKAIAENIWREREKILEANQRDLFAAKSLAAKGRYSEPFVRRLKLDKGKLRNIVDMISSVEALEEPVGKTEYAIELDESLELYRVTSPIGVIGVIFESRPDVLPQIAALCLKSGNATIMKGGSEAKNSIQGLYSVISEATKNTGVPEGWIQLLHDRSEVRELLKLDNFVDLIVPRGSNSFVKYIQSNTKIPVLGHSEGVCHIYVDVKADLKKAVEICYDSKVQYPSVCNAVDALLIHREIAERFLPLVSDRYGKAGVEIRGCKESVKILKNRAKQATANDWGTEYLDLIVAIKIVDSLDEAIDYINAYSSHHTDAIVTEDFNAASRFVREVDSSSVICNASTRFSDGYRYGLGAEVGISTGKIHARGPTGLEGLTIYKYYLIGSGQIVRDYVGTDSKKFTHRRLSKNWNDKMKEMSKRD